MGTNMEQPPHAQEEGSFDPDWELMVKQDGLWLHFPERPDMPTINLGDVDKAFERMAEKMAAADFGQ